MKGFNLQKMLKQAQKMQSAMASAQDELADIYVEGSAGGGAVKVSFNGKNEFQKIKLTAEAINPENPNSVDEEDIEALEDLITSAIKDASEKASSTAKEKISGITGGVDLNLPPGIM